MNLTSGFTTKDVSNLRKTLQLTHKQFADLLGISLNYQKQVECGFRNLSDAYLQRVDNSILRGNDELIRIVGYLSEVRQGLAQALPADNYQKGAG